MIYYHTFNDIYIAGINPFIFFLFLVMASSVFVYTMKLFAWLFKTLTDL